MSTAIAEAIASQAKYPVLGVDEATERRSNLLADFAAAEKALERARKYATAVADYMVASSHLLPDTFSFETYASSYHSYSPVSTHWLTVYLGLDANRETWRERAAKIAAVRNVLGIKSMRRNVTQGSTQYSGEGHIPGWPTDLHVTLYIAGAVNGLPNTCRIEEVEVTETVTHKKLTTVCR